MRELAPEAVLDFWFPDDGHWTTIESHRAFWTWRMSGGADTDIQKRFAEVTEAAARGQLDHWAATPRGRLALVIALDQFPRSYWRDEPQAFGQDIKTTRLVLEAMDNGHYDALKAPWEKQFCLIAVSHCEGPDHLHRMDLCVERTRSLALDAPEHLRIMYLLAIDQTMLVRSVVERFGRHPHRNSVLGRITTDAETAYIAAGDFPHQRKFPTDPAEVEATLRKRGLM
ncbi:MAG: DUF924 domain-containing protein [Paracoccaceae bacterium]|nr:DUF924 domain-containing protein [Paracoccaceae bacterium]